MKKITLSLLKKGSFSFVFLLLSPSYGQDIWTDLLAHVDKQFDAANSEEEKYNIVSRPLSLRHISTLKNINELDEQLLYKVENPDDSPEVSTKLSEEGCNIEKINILSISISCSNHILFKKFIKVVPNVNSSILAVGGYRELYSLAHVALDPWYAFAPKENVISIKNNCKIIDLIADKLGDFNVILSSHPYGNPPLAAGLGRGWNYAGDRLLGTHKFWARAILYGADPNQKGTYFHGLKIVPKTSKTSVDSVSLNLLS